MPWRSTATSAPKASTAYAEVCGLGFLVDGIASRLPGDGRERAAGPR
ncbi:hypothetical protein ACWCP6_23760 [Streptomyces sp. NPDC002004]